MMHWFRRAPVQKWSDEHPNGFMRFVERDGVRILQQQWFLRSFEGKEIVQGANEWRDVPLVIVETASAKED